MVDLDNKSRDNCYCIRETHSQNKSGERAYVVIGKL